jgi:hypothetical protein
MSTPKTRSHIGDPCKNCKTPHDKVAPGPCTGKALTNQQQRRYIKDRIDSIKSGAARKRWDIDKKFKTPARVIRAQKTIQEYNTKRSAMIEAEVKRLKLEHDDISRAAVKVREALLFATPEAALEELNKFAALYPFENL